jgi:hypothetical protein
MQTKDYLEGCRFNNAEEIKGASKILLRELEYGGYQKCFKLYEHQQKCVAAESI